MKIFQVALNLNDLARIIAALEGMRDSDKEKGFKIEGTKSQNLINRLEKIGEPVLPAVFSSADLERIGDLGLTVIAHQSKAVVDGGRVLYAPRDLIGKDGKTAILFRFASDGEYNIDGWEPWHDGMVGGRRECLSSALAWVERARDIRAGKASDFLGC